MLDYWKRYADDTERAYQYQAFIQRSYFRHLDLTNPDAKEKGADPLDLSRTELLLKAAAGDNNSARLVRSAILHAAMTTLDWMKKDAFLSQFEAASDTVLQMITAGTDGDIKTFFNLMLEFQELELQVYR